MYGQLWKLSGFHEHPETLISYTAGTSVFYFSFRSGWGGEAGGMFWWQCPDQENAMRSGSGSYFPSELWWLWNSRHLQGSFSEATQGECTPGVHGASASQRRWAPGRAVRSATAPRKRGSSSHLCRSSQLFLINLRQFSSRGRRGQQDYEGSRFPAGKQLLRREAPRPRPGHRWYSPLGKGSIFFPELSAEALPRLLTPPPPPAAACSQDGLSPCPLTGAAAVLARGSLPARKLLQARQPRPTPAASTLASSSSWLGPAAPPPPRTGPPHAGDGGAGSGPWGSECGMAASRGTGVIRPRRHRAPGPGRDGGAAGPALPASPCRAPSFAIYPCVC